jgi:hypothetical protein
MARSADKILSMQWRHSDPTRAISYKGGGVRISANFRTGVNGAPQG